MPTKTTVPAVDGLFTVEGGKAHLIGGKIPGRESYFFPKHLAGADPAVGPVELEEVRLSRVGTIWSFTNSEYPPPAPFVPRTDPYEPITIAAVELAAEKMVVLGQVADGWTVDDLEVGMEVELVIDTLYEDDDHVYTVWKWRPTGEER
ncbi:MAG: OB-fold domain-containing protein [Acidimicrobiia bacterium]|nr:OB-fold domain-containing protein [Acidimicrobiia bacterium]